MANGQSFSVLKWCVQLLLTEIHYVEEFWPIHLYSVALVCWCYICTVLLRWHHSISGLWPSYYNTSSLLFFQPFGCTLARVLGIIVLLNDPPTHGLTFDWNKAPRFCDSKRSPSHSSYEVCVLICFGFVCLAVCLDATLQTSWKQLVATLPLNFYGRSKHVLRPCTRPWRNTHTSMLGSLVNNLRYKYWTPPAPKRLLDIY